jgi:hypothetical protein
MSIVMANDQFLSTHIKPFNFNPDAPLPGRPAPNLSSNNIEFPVDQQFRCQPLAPLQYHLRQALVNILAPVSHINNPALQDT